MFRSLAFKLFAWVMLGNMVVLGFAAHTFNAMTERHFNEYLRRDFELELAALASDLGQWYAAQGSFDLLEDNPWLWERWLGRSLFYVQTPPGRALASRAEDAQEQADKSEDSSDINDAEQRRFPITLLDATGRHIVGPMPEHVDRTMPVVLDGQLVGVLLVDTPPFEQGEMGSIERHFEQQYRIGLMYFAGFLLLSSLLFSAWASWRIGRTLRRFGGALHQLAGGNHKVSLPLGGKDDLARLAGDIAQLGRTLAENETRQKRWLADVAHELRTPLAVLRGEVEALRDGVHQPDASTFQSLLHETNRLERLVRDLRQLALLDQGELMLERQPTELGELVQDTLRRHQAMLDKQQLTLQASLEPNLWLNLDEDRITQLLDNLVTNSCRFTESPGSVRVSLERKALDAGKGTRAVLVWEDSSPGVPEEDLPHLGERLFRPDPSRSRATGGSGLGLSIALGIARAHDWRMRPHRSALGGLRWVIETDALIDPPPAS